MHGLCTYGFSGRALVAELGNGDASAITSIDARFTKPVFPGETLTTFDLAHRTRQGGIPHGSFRANDAADATRGWCSRTARSNTRRASAEV